MSDTRLRELERRWRETGLPDDEAAYLLERVRVGDLTQERLELAAFCGHEGAATAAKARSVELEVPADTLEWALLVVQREAGAAVRLLVALAHACLGRWTSRYPADEVMALALERTRAWLDCPCAPCAAAAREAAYLVDDLSLADEEREDSEGAWMAAQIVNAAACIPGVERGAEEVLSTPVRYGITLVGHECARRAMAEVMVCWALAAAYPHRCEP